MSTNYSTQLIPDTPHTFAVNGRTFPGEAGVPARGSGSFRCRKVPGEIVRTPSPITEWKDGPFNTARHDAG